MNESIEPCWVPVRSLYFIVSSSKIDKRWDHSLLIWWRSFVWSPSSDVLTWSKRSKVEYSVGARMVVLLAFLWEVEIRLLWLLLMLLWRWSWWPLLMLWRRTQRIIGRPWLSFIHYLLVLFAPGVIITARSTLTRAVGIRLWEVCSFVL